MKPRSSRKTVTTKPTFKTFRLTVVMYNGVKMFFHPSTKRATAELRADQVPCLTLIELRRMGELLAHAKSTLVGWNDLTFAFEGTKPLVEKHAFLLREAGRHMYVPRIDASGGLISVLSRGVHIGDELVLNFPLTHVLGEKQVVNQQFAQTTLSTQDDVVEAYYVRQAWNQIWKMMPTKELASQFWYRHGEKPWREALRLAKRYVARRRRQS